MKSRLLISSFLLTLLALGASSRPHKASYCEVSEGASNAVKSWVELEMKVEGGALGGSFVERSIQSMGDEIAVALLHAYTEDELLQEERLRRVLPIVETAFSNKLAVACKENSEPRVTLLLLRSLRERTHDEPLRKQIAQLETKLTKR